MITCTLGEKKCYVDFVPMRALKEINPALEFYWKMRALGVAALRGEVPEVDLDYEKAIDEMVRWFCILFKNQFTPDDVYDNYPSDRFVADIGGALLAVQTGAVDVLSEFPTKAAEETTPHVIQEMEK